MKISEIETQRQLETPVENGTQRVLRKALELLGPNGEKWYRGWNAHDPLGGTDIGPNGTCRFCVGMAVTYALGGELSAWVRCDFSGAPEIVAMDLAAESLGFCDFETLNADGRTTFADVRKLYHRAITLAA